MVREIGVSFDAYQIKKKLDSNTGEVVGVYQSEISKDIDRFFRGLIVFTSFPILLGMVNGLAIFNMIGTGISVGMLYTVLMLLYMSQTVGNYKKYIKEIESNTGWKSRLRGEGSMYDTVLGITGGDFITDVEKLRRVYFNKETYKAYIPIQHLCVDDANPIKIVSEPVPNNYYTIDYFKDKVHRDTYLEMIKVTKQITPTFDECIVMLKSESEIVVQNNGLEPPSSTESGKVLSQNTDGVLKTIKQLGRQEKELINITNKRIQDLDTLKEDSLELVERATTELRGKAVTEGNVEK